jgi:hypothetical protein
MVWAPPFLALSLLAMLSACVVVPTSGPIERIEGQQPDCTNCLNIDVAPPSAGDDPKQIVEGYLRANANFQPSYAVARKFLTKAAAERWSPEAGVSIYTGTVRTDGNQVSLNGRQVGRLGPDRTFEPVDRSLVVDFGLVQESGQWRISTPRDGLLVADYAFDSFYESRNLYFIGNGRSLVPDPIYLPNLRNQAGLASALMRALVRGPSAWLKPAVTTAIPAATALSVDAVTVFDGVARVPLNDVVLPLNDSQRSLMAAQVVYTLAPIGIQAVLFTVDQKPYPIPGGDPDTFEVSIETSFGDLQPVPVVSGNQLFASRNGKIEVVNGDSNVPDPQPMDGPLGRGEIPVSSLGVSLSGTDIVAVTDNGAVLRRATTSGGPVSTALKDVNRLLRPQFSRFGEIWAIAERQGRQVLWVIDGDKRPVVMQPVVLRQGRVLAFKISPDGTRLAVILDVAGRTELGLLRIIRSSDRIAVDGWRPLQMNGTAMPRLTRMVDVAWADATNMVVLAGESGNVPLAPYRVSQDASQVGVEGEPNNWVAIGLTVSLQTQTAIVHGRDGQTWRDGGTQWVPYLKDVRAIAYPG